MQPLFICCGCAYESVIFTLRLLSSGKLFGCYQNFWFIVTEFKLQHCAVVEVIDPSKRAPASMPNIYKVFYNHHMLWMCI